ncbi:MAG: hypothetical protein RLZZ480_719 [Candidatus Parcubacteria bacterium]|jgi:hypothetical protein
MANIITKTDRGGAAIDTVASPGVNLQELQERITGLESGLDKTKNDQRELTNNLITIFGVFASLVTFLSVEVQILKTISNPFILIGLSMLLIAIVFSLIYSIDVIVKSESKIKWHPLLVLASISIVFSLISFIFSPTYKENGSCGEKECFHTSE